MGNLTPGATYIYERDGPTLYARKFGETERSVIGEDYEIGVDQYRMKLSSTWIPILEAAEHNPALQDALNRAKVIYELSKQHNTIMHHPV